MSESKAHTDPQQNASQQRHDEHERVLQAKRDFFAGSEAARREADRQAKEAMLKGMTR